MSADAQISKIVRKHDIQPGDPMFDVKGKLIPDSILIDRYTVIYRDGDGYVMLNEKPLSGEVSRQYFTAESMAVIKSMSF